MQSFTKWTKFAKSWTPEAIETVLNRHETFHWTKVSHNWNAGCQQGVLGSALSPCDKSQGRVTVTDAFEFKRVRWRARWFRFIQSSSRMTGPRSRLRNSSSSSGPERGFGSGTRAAAWDEPEFPAVDVFRLELESFAQTCAGESAASSHDSGWSDRRFLH